MDDGLLQALVENTEFAVSFVLILVVVDDGLVQARLKSLSFTQMCLNPCCSGRWSRTTQTFDETRISQFVLILVVVDDGLVHYHKGVVVRPDNGLNPCCSGRWSRTLIY